MSTLLRTMDLADESLRLVGFDPSSSSAGIAFLTIPISKMEVHVIDAYTIDTMNWIDHDVDALQIAEYYGQRQARLWLMGRHIEQVLEQFQPHRFVSEAAFIHIHSHAFEALVECIHTAKKAVINHPRAVGFDLIAPRQAKAVFGCTKSKEKDCIHRQLKNFHEDSQKALELDAQLDIDRCSDHAHDAIAIGYTKALTILEEIFPHSK